MRCPRCLRPWDPDYVDLGAEHAECRDCAHVVALLGIVVPQWARDEVASRLDPVGAVPALGQLTVGETSVPRAIELRGPGSFFRAAPRLSLGRSGAQSKRPFERAVTVPLAEVARVVPAVRFEWERDSRQDQKSLLATSVVLVAVQGDDGTTGPALCADSWEAARYVAARFERVRRALTETGVYR